MIALSRDLLLEVQPDSSFNLPRGLARFLKENRSSEFLLGLRDRIGMHMNEARASFSYALGRLLEDNRW